MRFIDQVEVQLLLPDDWDARVERALAYVDTKIEEARATAEQEGKTAAEIASAVLSARRKAITAQSAIWSFAGSKIKSVMHDKCWYCESAEVRSDMPVDHFRPKNSVAECPSHPGYWWLAFDWENYRYSCTYCNSRRVDVENNTEGGKQDHFPITPPPPWAMAETDDWRLEQPVLLDPLDVDDVKLLTFHENGLPREVIQDKTDNRYFRAERSIYFYHLDHIKAVRARKIIAIKIKGNYERIEKLLGEDQANPIIKSEVKKLKREIILLIREKASFCTAAKTYLQRYRGTPWVDELLERDL